MSKKSRRPTRKANKPRATALAADSRPPVAAVAAAPTTRAPAATNVDLAQEYHYVLNDLRRIAIITAAMFVLLLAIAFVWR